MKKRFNTMAYVFAAIASICFMQGLAILSNEGGPTDSGTNTTDCIGF